MKYSEFLQLYELLEAEEQGEETSGPKELDTEKGGIVSRWGRLKSKLNKVGKNTQKQLMDKVLNKYFPQILQSEKKILEAVKSQNLMGDQAKLRQFVNTQYGLIKKQQENQTNIIESSVNKFLENVTDKMYKTIDKSKAKDSNKLVLKNYWNLLVTQIAMNSSMYMVKEREKIIDEIFAKDKEAAEAAKKALKQREITAKRKQKAEEEKAKMKQIEAKIKEAFDKEEKEEKETQPMGFKLPDTKKTEEKPKEEEKSKESTEVEL